MSSNKLRPVEWIGSSYKDFREFPDSVQHTMGFALYLAQIGGMHLHAKPLKGFGGSGIIEIAEDQQGDTYRAVYTVKFDSAVYVLHAFQKKATHGIKTAQQDIELVRRRLRAAEDDHNTRKRETL